MSHDVKRVDVLWLIEHPVRELDVACAVRALAERKYGLCIEVEPLGADKRKMAVRYAPKVITVPYGFSALNAHVPEILGAWPEAVCLNLSWEELYYAAYLGARAPSDEWSRRQLLHHVWGDFFRTYLLSHQVPDDHILVNGQPAYALYDLPYRRLFERKDDLAGRLGIDPGRRWIFFPENYGWAFKDDHSLAKLVTQNGMDLSELEEMRAYCLDSLHAMLGWAVEACRQSPIEFILRPRPATGQTKFESFVRQSVRTLPSNLHVTDVATVREWILASDIVMSSISTSLIEAAVAHKPAYMVEPSPIPRPLQADWHKHAMCLPHRDAFLAVCEGAPYRNSSRRLAEWARSTMLAHGDPIEGLAEILWQLSREAPAGSKKCTVEDAGGASKSAVPSARDLFSQGDVERRTHEFSALLREVQEPSGIPLGRRMLSLLSRSRYVQPSVMVGEVPSEPSPVVAIPAAPNRWPIEGVDRRWLAQEYAGFAVVYSEGTSLMKRLSTQDDVYEPRTLERISEEIRRCGATRFLDIGANIGLISLGLLARFPLLQIDAFEPGPHQADLLDATIRYSRLQDLIRLHRVALGNENREAEFVVHATVDASGDGLVDTGRAGPATAISVPMKKLDTWWVENGRFSDNCFVKLDTEGAELWVLKGAEDFLQAVKPVVLLEISELNLRNYPYGAADIVTWLSVHRYLVETLDGERVTEKNRDACLARGYSFVARPSTD